MNVEARLRAFAAVARERSFSRAAAALFVSQPAVSKHVASLEAELGTMLIVRGARGVSLTPSGQVLADYVLRAEALLANARRALAAGGDAQVGKLALAASGTPGTYLLPEPLSRFHEQHPGVEIDFRLATSGGALELVRAHEVEVAVVGGLTVPAELESEPLLEDEIVLIGPPSLGERRLRPKDLEGWTWITREEGSSTKAAVEAARWQAGLHEVRTLELPSWEAVKLAVAAGAGVAAISRFALALERKTGALAVLDVPRWRLTRSITMVTAGGVPLTPPAERFLSILRDCFRTGEELPPNSNLPAAPTPLFGRETELREIATSLTRSRLVTLTGPGGSGKTSLALTAAGRCIDRFRDGVYFVDLTPVREPERVLGSIADAVGSPSVAQLDERLANRSMLLVLDNFEHVLGAAAEIAHLVERGRGCTVLATSRSPLRVRGEQVLQVPALANDDAISLFVHLGRALRPAIEADRDVAAICERLDGLPLAIELAAARSNVLSPRELRVRVERDLDVLVSARRDIDRRHRTLRATIEWSVALLRAESRALFAGLAAFAGGWSFDAVEPVCQGTLESMTELVEHNLVRRDGDRFAMLDTIHRYASDLLDAQGSGEETRRRHAEFFAALAEEASPHLSGPKQAEWVPRLRQETENVRAAVAWANARRERELQLRIAGAAWQLWIGMSGRDEWQAWLEQALADVTDPRLRLLALAPLSWMALHDRDYERAEPLARERVRLAELVGAPDHLAGGLSALASAADARGDASAALELAERGVEVARRSGDETSIAIKVNNLGGVHFNRRDFDAARACFEEARKIALGRGDEFLVADITFSLARVELRKGTGAAALVRAREALPSMSASGDVHAIWMALEITGASVVAAGRAADGIKVLGAADAARLSAGDEPNADGASMRSDALAAAERAIGRKTVSKMLQAGRALTTDEAVALALES